MSANLDHWYPGAEVYKNPDADNWVYKVHNRRVVHFRTKTEAHAHGRTELYTNVISYLHVHKTEHRFSRLYKAIEEYRREGEAEKDKEIRELNRKLSLLVSILNSYDEYILEEDA
jgi:hypothetical protein